jgi:hypothetical protein
LKSHLIIFQILPAGLAVAIMASSCSGNPATAKSAPASPDCIGWNHYDSLAMELSYLTNHGNKDELKIYDSISRIPHSLPAMNLSLGLLYADRHDSIMAMRYYEREIALCRKVIRSKASICRKYRYFTTLHHALIADRREREARELVAETRKLKISPFIEVPAAQIRQFYLMSESVQSPVAKRPESRRRFRLRRLRF